MTRSSRASVPPARSGTWLPRIIVWLGTVLACLLLVAPWALLTARTEANFGPHMAEYSLTADSTATIDLGPLGSVLVPVGAHLPAGLGVHVDVSEIPQESALGGTTLDALGEDVTAYATFFTAPEAQIESIARGLLADALTRELAAGLGLAAVVGLAVYARPQATPRGRPAARTTATLAAGTACALLAAWALVPLSVPQRIDPNPAFAGTPLEGAQVTGRLSGVIDEVTALVGDFADDNDAFYSAALASLDEQWEERPETARMSSSSMLVPPPDGGSREGGRGGTGVLTAVFASDIHCNIGMSRVIGDVVARAQADVYIDGGDITMTGTPAENLCVDSVDHELAEDLPKIFVKGNHDSLDTAAHARSIGWNVLDSEPVEIDGLTFFGGPDPRRTVFGVEEPVLETGETAAEFSARMAEEACTAEPNVLLIHDPRHASDAMGAGCAPLSLSGHWHRSVGPEPYGRGARYVSSTTGGALANALTPGPLKMPAELGIVRFDRATGRAIDVQVVTVDMEANVTFSSWLPFPQPGPWAPEIGEDENP